MGTPTVKIRITRPCYIAGQRREVDAICALDPLIANDVILCAKGELLDPGDATPMRDAVRANNNRLANLRAPWEPPAPGPEWQKR